MPFPDISKYLDTVDWRKGDFEVTKGLVCCLFAQYAYEHIPEFELTGTDRLKLIPYFDFRALLAAGQSKNLRFTAEGERGDLFVVETARAIALGVALPKMIIIAIRGTAPWYSCPDWSINLNIKKISLGSKKVGALHRGFFEATKDLVYKLGHELKRWSNRDLPVYVTGHSLGGAMSGILHGLWSSLPDLTATNLTPTSAYTFGAPRYATANAIAHLPNPYHVYSPKDIVPRIPPRWKSFADCQNEYWLAPDKPAIAKTNGRVGAGLRGVKFHKIERYRKSLYEIVEGEE
jgi:hypothetical protein